MKLFALSDVAIHPSRRHKAIFYLTHKFHLDYLIEGRGGFQRRANLSTYHFLTSKRPEKCFYFINFESFLRNDNPTQARKTKKHICMLFLLSFLQKGSKMRNETNSSRKVPFDSILKHAKLLKAISLRSNEIFSRRNSKLFTLPVQESP